jgi:ATP-dependent helicase/nuclease subunit A
LFSGVKESTDNEILKCYRVKGDVEPSGKKLLPNEEKALDGKAVSEFEKTLKDAKESSPYKSPLSHAAAKISVSKLKKGLLDEEQAISMETILKPMPKFMQGLEKTDASERGTAVHTFMQFCNLENLEEKGAAFEADRLLELGFIDKRMREIIDLTVLDAFVRSRLYAEMKKAPKLYRERRFNLKLAASEFTENPSPLLADEFILVQGVSDLYFEGDDGNITLVDFKTDKVSEADGEKVLKERHSMQLGYYKRAIEEITGKTVSRVYVYSFALGREIDLDI